MRELLRNLGVETLGIFYQHRVDPATPIEVVAETCGELIREERYCTGACARSMLKPSVGAQGMSGYGHTERVSLHAPRGGRKRRAGALRGTGYRFRAVQPAEPWFPRRHDKRVHPVRHRQRQPPDASAFPARSHPCQHAYRGGTERFRTDERHYHGAGGIGMAAEQEAFIVPIPGTTKLSHLEENLRACDIVFTSEEVTELEKAVAAIPVVGSRYDALQESKIQK